MLLRPEDYDWRDEILELLDAHHGETGAAEGALDTLRRLTTPAHDHRTHRVPAY